jgi:hypothetical protein
MGRAELIALINYKDFSKKIVEFREANKIIMSFLI